MEDEVIVVESTTPNYVDIIKESAVKAVTVVVITAVASSVLKLASAKVTARLEARKAKKNQES